MSSYLFLYGTLLCPSTPTSGALGTPPNHAPEEIASAVRKLRRFGEGTVRGHLYDLGQYPGALLDESAGGRIHGTVFELPDDQEFLNQELLSTLDRYEDFDPKSPEDSLFVRTLQPVTLTTGELLECWIYIYNRDPGRARRIPSGRYSS